MAARQIALFLVFAGLSPVAIVTGQELCGKVNGVQRYCVDPAVCDPVTESCLCPSGQYGNGLIDCVEAGFDNCVLYKDPKIVLFPNSTGTLCLPCPHLLTKVVVPVEDVDDKFCVLYVYGSTEMINNGRYYETDLAIQFSVGKFQPGGGGPFIHDKKIFFRIDDTFVIRTTQTHGWATPIQQWFSFNWHTESWSRTFGANGEVTINIYSDGVNNSRVTWEVPECGLRVRYRAFEPFQLPQVNTPGISIVVPPRASFNGSACQLPYSLCDTPNNDESDLAIKAAELNLDTNEYLFYASIQHMPQFLTGPNKYKCVKLLWTLNTFCDTTEMRTEAIRVCKSITCNPKTAACLKQRINQPLDVLNKCVECVCNTFNDPASHAGTTRCRSCLWVETRVVKCFIKPRLARQLDACNPKPLKFLPVP